MEFDRHTSDKDTTVSEDDVVYLGEEGYRETATKSNQESLATPDRAAIVADILAQHVPFKNDPFQPRPTLGRVYRRPASWFGRIKKLHPVAFRADIKMIETMGCVSSFGCMYPYLWVDADTRLIGQLAPGRFVPLDANSLTDEDVANLAIGVKGDGNLLDAEYEKVHQRMLREVEKMH